MKKLTNEEFRALKVILAYHPGNFLANQLMGHVEALHADIDRLQGNVAQLQGELSASRETNREKQHQAEH